ncbi:hypothetical protein C8D77_101256 [Mesorhizobium loti]|uniref:Uncharacterized protein n=1 Tax=Rhizobium loti TaxID=381 RepID=A0A8E3B6Z0_RHILI|nr:hypothetical protein [Mesorhizobium loti]PWJ93577.1 hypothetical protein C8D77_101256 [Mesorhizobium loti]
MSDPEPPSFHIRFFPGLKEKLEGVRGSRSLNREINERLQRSFEADVLAKLAETIRPILGQMSEAERSDLTEAITSVVRDLAKTPRKRQPRK